MIGSRLLRLLKQRKELSSEEISLNTPVNHFGRSEKKNATLILIDRSVDLVAPMNHGDNVLDRIFEVFPRENVKSPEKDLAISPDNSINTTELRKGSDWKICNSTKALSLDIHLPVSFLSPPDDQRIAFPYPSIYTNFTSISDSVSLLETVPKFYKYSSKYLPSNWIYGISLSHSSDHSAQDLVSSLANRKEF